MRRWRRTACFPTSCARAEGSRAPPSPCKPRSPWSLTASSGLAELLGYAGFTLSLCSAATVAALIWLRRREGAERVPLPGWPFVPGLFVAATASAALLMVVHEPRIAGIGLLTLLAGLPVYWATSRSGPFWAGASVARSER